MNTYDLIAQNFDELYHHGIKGQKWGVRRFQNPDGSLTAAGKKRYLKQQEAIRYLDSNRKAHLALSEKDEKQASAYLKNPDKIAYTLTATRIGPGTGPKKTEIPVYAHEEASRLKNEAKWHRQMAKDYANLVKRYSDIPVSKLRGEDYKVVKWYGKRYTDFYLQEKRKVGFKDAIMETKYLPSVYSEAYLEKGFSKDELRRFSQ